MASRLIPLESNPDVMNKFLIKLGVTSSEYQFCDVLGTDDEVLAMVPQPAIALLFLFPCTDNYEKLSKDLVTKAKDQSVSSSLYFMEQTIGNACGTVAVIHSLANNTDIVKIDPAKPLGKFLEATKSMSAKERAKQLETDSGICGAHEEMAKDGQTAAPDRDDSVNHHFIAFVEKDGTLYELDGRKPVPINRKATTANTLLKDAASVCKEYMTNDPKEVNFTMIALAKA